MLLLAPLSVRAEYCLDYSAGVMSLARQAGSSGSRGCVATKSQCESARMSHPSSYSGSCYYVPGLYPPEGGNRAGGAGSTVDQAAKASAAAQQKIRQQQAADEAAAQRAAQQARQQLLGNLKGVPTSSPNSITLKLPPPASTGPARSQLNCVARSAGAAAQGQAAALGPSSLGREHHGDFESGEDCTPPNAAVPPASPPTPVDEIPTEPGALAQFLAALTSRLETSRQALAQQDRDIAALEATVAREEQQPPKLDLKTAAPAVQSDALRKAREALAKARADRQKTAADYEKLQQQAQTARERQAAP